MTVKGKLLMLLKGFVIVNILWFLAALAVDKRLLPTPLAVYSAMPGMGKYDLPVHVAMSLYRIGAGILVATALGVAIGLAMAGSGRWNKLLGLTVYFTYPIPKTVLLPVLMLLFGLGNLSKVLLIVLIVVFQVIIASRDAVMNISPETYALVDSLGAGRIQRLVHVTLPAVVPGLLTSLRVSVGTALSILFFAEAYGTDYGIGYFILDAWSRIDYIGMYAGIVVISLTGLCLFAIVDLIEEKVCRWQRKSHFE